MKLTFLYMSKMIEYWQFYMGSTYNMFYFRQEKTVLSTRLENSEHIHPYKDPKRISNPFLPTLPPPSVSPLLAK